MRRIMLFLCCLAMTMPAHALRCGTGVVSKGDNVMKLLHACGEPTMKEQQERRVQTRRYDPARGVYYDDYVGEPYEIWIYNFGPRRLMQRITVEDGKIKAIESDGYGF